MRAAAVEQDRPQDLLTEGGAGIARAVVVIIVLVVPARIGSGQGRGHDAVSEGACPRCLGGRFVRVALQGLAGRLEGVLGVMEGGADVHVHGAASPLDVALGAHDSGLGEGHLGTGSGQSPLVVVPLGAQRGERGVDV